MDFTDVELDVLEVALTCYRNQLAADAMAEPIGSVSGRYTTEGEQFLRWAFTAQDLLLRFDIDPAESQYTEGDLGG